MIELYKRFASNNLLILVGHLFVYGRGILLIPLIVWSAGVTVYGGYILLTTLLGFVVGISSFGFGFQRSRFLPSTDEKQTKQILFYRAFTFQLISICCLSAVLTFCYPLLDDIFFKGRVAFSKNIIAPYLFSYFLYSQSTDYFRYTHRMNYFGYATTSYPYIQVGLVFLAYVFRSELTVNMLLLAEMIAFFLVSLPLVIKMIGEIGFRFVLPDSLKNFISDVRLGLPIVLGYLMDVILSSSDRYIIAALISVTAVGYYSPAYAMGSLVIFFAKVSGVVLPPLLCRAVDTHKVESACTMLNYTLKGFLLLAVPFTFGSYVLGRPLLAMLTNAEVGNASGLVVPIVALGTLFYGLNVILSNVFFVQMATKVIFKMSVWSAVLNCTLNIIFIYIFNSIIVAAVTTFISYLIVFIFTRRTVMKNWPLDFSIITVIKSVIASLIMGVILYSFISQSAVDVKSPLMLLFAITIGILVYSISLIMLHTFSRKEIAFLKVALLQWKQKNAQLS
ncbi:MAG: polysaccharide biosynthesis C-terminal domain-containing protein [Deltaproteobacteria bacterium]|nr:polysaccharide biosynthesis C-terminal domain-containing protein [Deltaproteobacteria bacterium]